MARQRSLPELLRAITSGISRCKQVVLARIWLIDAGDICPTCPLRSECPDQTRCLHLVASAGNSADLQADSRRLDGAFRRFPLGVRKIGRVALKGEPLLLSGVAGEEEWIADREWWRREKVRSFAAQPLVFRGETLGVLAIFDRGVLDDKDFDWSASRTRGPFRRSRRCAPGSRRKTPISGRRSRPCSAPGRWSATAPASGR